MASVAATGQDEDSQTASIAVTGQDKDSQTASIAVTGQDKDSQTASIAVTGQDKDSYEGTTDTSGGSAADAATSGGSTAVNIRKQVEFSNRTGTVLINGSFDRDMTG